MVADEHEPLGAIQRGQRRRLGQLAGLVDDRHVELLFAHDAGATTRGRRRHDGRAVERASQLSGVALGVEPHVEHILANPGRRADALDVLEALRAKGL